MRRSSIRGGRRLRNQRGGAYLLMVVLIFSVAVGVLATIQFTQQTYFQVNNAADYQQATNLAEAGISRALWELSVGNSPAPISVSETLGGGSYTAQLTDNSGSLKKSVKIVSTGVYKRQTVTLTKVLGNRLPTLLEFDTAIFCTSNFNVSQRIFTYATTWRGDVYIDGNFRVNTSGSIINGHLLVEGNLNGGSPVTVTGQTKTNYTSQSAASINSTTYALTANRIYLGSRTSSGFTFNQPYEVVYIAGDLNLNAGTITGTGTVVADKININGSVRYSSTADKAAFLADDNITVNGSYGLDGFYYADDKTFKTNGSVTIYSGSVCAKTFDLGGSLSVYYDGEMQTDPDLGAKMQLPGYD